MTTTSIRWLVAACLGHALIVTVLWVLVFKFDIDLIPAKVWTVLGLAWPLWVIAVFFSPRPTVRNWVIALVAGIVILVPSIPTLYTFAAWTIGGFAP